MNILVSVLILSFVGLIYSFETQGSVEAFLIQLGFVGAGFLFMMFFSKFRYQNLKKYSVFLLLAGFALIALVLIPGLGLKINGARRWLDLKLFTFQPAEFVKMSLIIFLAHWFENKEKNRDLAFILLIGFVFGLVMLQPDMGTAIIILIISFLMFFVSETTEIKKILLVAPFVFCFLFLLIKTSDYRFMRLMSFLDVNKEKYGQSYHINQALISIGRGGIFGVGIGKSKQKYSYLPENNTDSIFGIIAEETGFVGGALILYCYLNIFIFGYKLSKKTDDLFGKYLSFGATTLIFVQSFINLSAMMSLLPLTGVPLPFISSGGSAIVIQFILVGILLNINKKKAYV